MEQGWLLNVIPVEFVLLRLRQRNKDRKHRASPQYAVDQEFAIQGEHALLDAYQSESVCRPRRFAAHAYAVVLNSHHEPVAFLAQLDGNARRVGMSDYVVQRFLQDAEESGGNRIVHIEIALVH